MPIYEFQCQACGTQIEVLQKISDPHLTDCEACGKPEMKKNVTAAAFRLSGAGWYETDFKEGDKKKNLTETENKSDKKDKSSDSEKTETRPSSADKSTESSAKSAEKSSDKTKTEPSTKKTTPAPSGNKET